MVFDFMLRVGLQFYRYDDSIVGKNTGGLGEHLAELGVSVFILVILLVETCWIFNSIWCAERFPFGSKIYLEVLVIYVFWQYGIGHWM